MSAWLPVGRRSATSLPFLVPKLLNPATDRTTFGSRSLLGDFYPADASIASAPGQAGQTPINGSAPADNGATRTIIDLSAAGAAKFYHVDITKP